MLYFNIIGVYENTETIYDLDKTCSLGGTTTITYSLADYDVNNTVPTFVTLVGFTLVIYTPEFDSLTELKFNLVTTIGTSVFIRVVHIEINP